MSNTLKTLCQSAVLAALSLSVTTADATAQTAETEAKAAPVDTPVNTLFGDWAIRCDAVTVTRNICRLMQEQVLRTDNTLVVRMMGLPAAEDGAVMLAQVPMGIYLPGGAVFRLENDAEAEQVEMIWQRCFAQVCEAAIALTAEQVDMYDTGGSILFGYRTGPEAEPIVTRVNMENFSAGIAALKASEE